MIVAKGMSKLKAAKAMLSMCYRFCSRADKVI